MTFNQTTDTALIKQTITHPLTYKWQCDDKSPAPEDFTPPSGVLYVAVHDGPEYIGLFCLVPLDADSWEIHTCLLPNAWGRTVQIYREGIEWTWRTHRRDRIVGHIRSDNRLALRAAKRAGLKQVRELEIPGNLHYTIELEIRWVESRKESERVSLAD